MDNKNYETEIANIIKQNKEIIKLLNTIYICLSNKKNYDHTETPWCEMSKHDDILALEDCFRQLPEFSFGITKYPSVFDTKKKEIRLKRCKTLH